MKRKLLLSQVDEIRNLYLKGLKISEISKKFKVHNATIYYHLGLVDIEGRRKRALAYWREYSNGSYKSWKLNFKNDKKFTCGNCGLKNNLAGFLQIDHIDGNHKNNVRENLQVLCPNCHILKTIKNGENKHINQRSK